MEGIKAVERFQCTICGRVHGSITDAQKCVEKCKHPCQHEEVTFEMRVEEDYDDAHRLFVDKNCKKCFITIESKEVPLYNVALSKFLYENSEK